jgi:hypothetical protein
MERDEFGPVSPRHLGRQPNPPILEKKAGITRMICCRPKAFVEAGIRSSCLRCRYTTRNLTGRLAGVNPRGNEKRTFYFYDQYSHIRGASASACCATAKVDKLG